MTMNLKDHIIRARTVAKNIWWNRPAAKTHPDPASQEEMDATAKYVDKMFEKYNERFDKMEKQINSLSKAVNTIHMVSLQNGVYGKVDEDVDKTIKDFEALSKDFNNLDTSPLLKDKDMVGKKDKK